MPDEDKSIEALQNLLQGAESEEDIELLKAKKKSADAESESDEDEDEDEGGEYMKKKKMATRGGGPGSYMKKMKKAVDYEYDEVEEELHEADATIVDGTAMFEAFKDLATGMMKALSDLGQRIETVEDKVAFNEELSKATGSVLIKATNTIEQMAGQPNPVKGVEVAEVENQDNGDQPLQKAAGLGVTRIKQLLTKAVMEGNVEAGRILTQVECCHNNLNLVPASSMKVIESLIPASS